MMNPRTIVAAVPQYPSTIIVEDGHLTLRKVNVELFTVQQDDNSYTDGSDSDGSGSGGGSCVGGPRKRKRLTHLTPEEKMVRR